MLSFLLSSCEKVYLVPESELPQWLKATIQEHEKAIEENPKGWPISHSGDTLDVWVGDTHTDYHNEKCCKTFFVKK